MLARDWIIVLVLFGLVSGIGYLVVEDIASSERGYDVANMTDEDYTARYNTLTNSTTAIYKMQNATTSEKGLSFVSAAVTAFSAVFSIVGIVFGSIGMATATMNNFAQDLGMSAGLTNLIAGSLLLIIITLIVFIVISSISQGRL